MTAKKRTATRVPAPEGMHWHRRGNIWYLIRHLYQPAIVGYVVGRKTSPDPSAMFWTAVWKPDTIECIAFDTREAAQRLLADTIANA